VFFSFFAVSTKTSLKWPFIFNPTLVLHSWDDDILFTTVTAAMLEVDPILLQQCDIVNLGLHCVFNLLCLELNVHRSTKTDMHGQKITLRNNCRISAF